MKEEPEESESPFTEFWECQVCGLDAHFLPGVFPGVVPFCPDCKKRYPPSLLKACQDPFDYALRLRTGEVVRFQEAEIHGEYATLHGDGSFIDERPVKNLCYPCPRGVDVRIADIVWCVDAPEGS